MHIFLWFYIFKKQKHLTIYFLSRIAITLDFVMAYLNGSIDIEFFIFMHSNDVTDINVGAIYWKK